MYQELGIDGAKYQGRESMEQSIKSRGSMEQSNKSVRIEEEKYREPRIDEAEYQESGIEESEYQGSDRWNTVSRVEEQMEQSSRGTLAMGEN